MTPFLRLGDCLDLMRDLPDASVDAIVTDPPYFLPAKHYATRKSFRRNFSDLMFVEFFFRQWFEQCERILRDTGHLYVFCDGQSYPLFFYHAFFFTKSARPLIWDKQTAINGYAWRHQHELILYGEMPKAKPIATGDGDVLRYRAVPVNDRVHPAQKPDALLDALVAKCGSVILDPFMGSNSTGRAAARAGKQYIGFELDPTYFEMAQRATANAPVKMNERFETEQMEMQTQ